MLNSLSICVYCGSAHGASPAYGAAAEQLGQAIAQASARLVYGGGDVGLMGATARAARDAGGQVLGVIPEFLLEKEGLLGDIDNRIVKTMHERKMLMFEEADAFAVLPGGIGTLEEVIETLSWMRLQLHAKPVFLIDIDGFWRPLLDLLDHIVATGFAPEWFREAVHVAESPRALLAAAEAHLVRKVV